MPELVEALLSDGAPVLRVYVARAYATAAEPEDEPRREEFLERAESSYKSLLELQNSPGWSKDETGGVAVAEWQVEWADLVLRQRAGPELDRLEITSGLSFDRRRLASALDQVLRLGAQAKDVLDQLVVGLQENEEKHLLLGLADRIPALAAKRTINQAWAQLYRAQVCDSEEPARVIHATAALSAFDEISRREVSAMQKYNAVLGAAIALREMGRMEDSLTAFDRVIASTAPAGTLVRARFEKARCLMGLKRYDAARAEFSAIQAPGTEKGDKGTGFYVGLAPVISAYCDALDAGGRPPDDPRKRELQGRADQYFEQLGRKPGWREIVSIYQEALGGRAVEPASMSESQLRSRGEALMAQGRYDDAIVLLRTLTERSLPDEDKQRVFLNLGVCHFQAKSVRAAADAFAKAAALGGTSESAVRAVEFAYQAYRDIARSTRQAADYSELARSAQRLVELASQSPLAAEGAWVGAIAFEETGDFRAAQRLYERVPKGNANEQAARRGAARCAQWFYEKLGEKTPPDQRRAAAREAANAWLQLVRDFEAAGVPAASTQATTEPSDRRHAEVRVAAAAVLAGSDLREFDEALSVIAELPEDDAVLVLRIRSYSGSGRIEDAKRDLNRLISRPDSEGVSSVLGGFVSQVEREIERLRNLGKREEVRKLAEQTVPLLDSLVQWASLKPERKKFAGPVRAALARLLRDAGRSADAGAEWERLIESDPGNGAYLREAALVQEALASSGESTTRKAAQERAEALWARLLSDSRLRESFPNQYWEARYHWLSHQLRRGRSREVHAAIDSERAWYPDLGGAPWQARLLDLAERARSQLEAPAP